MIGWVCSVGVAEQTGTWSVTLTRTVWYTCLACPFKLKLCFLSSRLPACCVCRFPPATLVTNADRFRKNNHDLILARRVDFYTQIRYCVACGATTATVTERIQIDPTETNLMIQNHRTSKLRPNQMSEKEWSKYRSILHDKNYFFSYLLLG